MLNGKLALVIEGELLIALDIERILEVFNPRQVLLARSALEAGDLETRIGEIGLAMIETRDGDTSTNTILMRLTAAGVPIVITSSDSRLRRGMPGFPEIPVIVKPFSENDLIEAARRALRPDQA